MRRRNPRRKLLLIGAAAAAGVIGYRALKQKAAAAEAKQAKPPAGNCVGLTGLAYTTCMAGQDRHLGGLPAQYSGVTAGFFNDSGI